MTEQVEFASPEWLELARAYLAEAAERHRDELAGLPRVAVGEVVNGAPAHLGPDEHGRLAWWYEFRDGGIAFGRGARDDLDVVLTGDYEQVLPMARLRFRDIPPDPSAPALDFPPVVARIFVGMHDHLAARTR